MSINLSPGLQALPTGPVNKPVSATPMGPPAAANKPLAIRAVANRTRQAAANRLAAWRRLLASSGSEAAGEKLARHRRVIDDFIDNILFTGER